MDITKEGQNVLENFLGLDASSMYHSKTPKVKSRGVYMPRGKKRKPNSQPSPSVPSPSSLSAAHATGENDDAASAARSSTVGATGIGRLEVKKQKQEPSPLHQRVKTYVLEAGPTEEFGTLMDMAKIFLPREGQPFSDHGFANFLKIVAGAVKRTWGLINLERDKQLEDLYYTDVEERWKAEYLNIIKSNRIKWRDEPRMSSKVLKPFAKILGSERELTIYHKRNYLTTFLRSFRPKILRELRFTEKIRKPKEFLSFYNAIWEDNMGKYIKLGYCRQYLQKFVAELRELGEGEAGESSEN